jgi:SAM-dependent methyltransferase
VSDYLFDHAAEQRRLAALAALHDADTFEHLSRVGVAEGWHCLEIGTGAGTVARWLVERVGVRGRVVATDLEPRGLEGLAAAGVEVRRHDIGRESLEERAFDLVYARAVLQHVPQRAAALQRMASALRPGGTLLVEDTLMPQSRAHPRLPVWERIVTALEMQLRRMGAEPYFGLQLESSLRDAGLREVRSAARVSVMTSGTPRMEFILRTLDQIGERLIDAQVVRQDELVELRRELEAPGCTMTSAIMIATWGVR